ncbi:carbohydrate-binding module family 14 protein [Sagittula salina]|uniref:Adenylosuccinate lyase n=1 Tax=Sagittula salina TaxID=2820268 RepID=A0A940ML61_9RHOB|nr:carbohydrate-binding module family 14 protein [Sagittula salina]MBP0481785.1 adenylosuccinate lyase [Sagittula salina]
MTRTIFTALILTLAPLAASACPFHDAQAMSCAEGTVFDADSKSCKVVSS